MKGAGRLSEPVTIRRRTISYDDYGQPVDGAANDSQVWAEVIYPGSASESVKAAQVYPERSVTFVIRHTNPTNTNNNQLTFNESDVIMHDGIEHDIIGIAPIGRRDGLTVYCKRKGTHNV